MYFQLLREKLTEYDNKFKELQEKMDDVQAEKVTIDSTYKQSVLSFYVCVCVCLFVCVVSAWVYRKNVKVNI